MLFTRCRSIQVHVSAKSRLGSQMPVRVALPSVAQAVLSLQVNQGNSKALGSGLGYLEHICQLIEKIGQLQEHNLRLQKQVCSLQKEQKMSQIKEVSRQRRIFH